MDVFFIYGLVDSGEPDVVRYVGQTASLSGRLKQHASGALDCGPASMWKWSVEFFGRQLDMRLLEVVYGDRRKAIGRELWHIARHDSGRLVNGPQYRQAQQVAGVPGRVVAAYQASVMALRGLASAKKKKRTRPAFDAAKAIDELETEYKSLMMCGQLDSFYQRLWKFKEIRNSRIDRLAVSR